MGSEMCIRDSPTTVRALLLYHEKEFSIFFPCVDSRRIVPTHAMYRCFRQGPVVPPELCRFLDDNRTPAEGNIAVYH